MSGNGRDPIGKREPLHVTLTRGGAISIVSLALAYGAYRLGTFVYHLLK